MNVKKMVLDASCKGIAVSTLTGITSEFGVDPESVAQSIFSLVGDNKISFVNGVITATPHIKTKEVKEYTTVHPEKPSTPLINPFVDYCIEPVEAPGTNLKSKSVGVDIKDVIESEIDAETDTSTKAKIVRKRSGHPNGYIEKCVREEIAFGPIGKNDTKELALKYNISEDKFRKGLYRLKANGSITRRKTENGYVYHSNWVRSL